MWGLAAASRLWREARHVIVLILVAWFFKDADVKELVWLAVFLLVFLVFRPEKPDQ